MEGGGDGLAEDGVLRQDEGGRVPFERAFPDDAWGDVALALDGGVGLFHQFLAVDQDGGAVTFPDRFGDDFGQDDGLAGAGGGAYQQGFAAAGFLPYFIDDPVLVIPELKALAGIIVRLGAAAGRSWGAWGYDTRVGGEL